MVSLSSWFIRKHFLSQQNYVCSGGWESHSAPCRVYVHGVASACKGTFYFEHSCIFSLPRTLPGLSGIASRTVLAGSGQVASCRCPHPGWLETAVSDVSHSLLSRLHRKLLDSSLAVNKVSYFANWTMASFFKDSQAYLGVSVCEQVLQEARFICLLGC